MPQFEKLLVNRRKEIVGKHKKKLSPTSCLLKTSQQGIAQLFLLIIIVAAIALGIYLIQTKTNLLPKAAVERSTPKVGFSLGSGIQQVAPGGEFNIKVGASSDFDAANLFTLVMNYPTDKVQILSISPGMEASSSGDTFVKKWIEQTDDKQGKITLSGAVPNPGFKTETGQTYTMATIKFKSLINSGEIPFVVNGESAIYRNSDNQNIIGANNGVTVKVGAQPSPIASASIKPYYRVFVTNGDYNGDIYEPFSLIRGVNGADAICQSLATNSNLGGKWRAWLADDTLASGPYNKFLGYHENDQNPFRLLDGTIIADNYNDLLDGSLKQPISITEVGGKKSFPVWTNTKANGATGGVSINGSLQHCNNWKTSNPNLNGNTGNSGRVDGGWTEGSYLNCRNRAALYCFDQNTTTTVPGVLPIPNASIQITYPNGGEIINTGSSVKVTWKQANMQKCDLRAYDENGNFLDAFYQVTPSAGSFDWFIKPTLFPGDSVKAKMEMECRDNKAASFYFDQSDNFFTLTKAAPAYTLEARPNSNIEFALNQKFGIGVTLKENGNVVKNQSGFNFSWVVGDNTIIKSEPWASNSTTDCSFGILPPCPLIQSELTGLRGGSTFVKVFVANKSTNQKVAEVIFNVTVSVPVIDPKRADLYKDSNKPNFVNDQDISVFFTKCAEKGIELFGQPASVQPICDINNDGTINSPDWSILIKYRNQQV